MNKNTQYIDIKHLDEISSGDKNFKKELIGIFLEQIPEFIKNLNDFFKVGNFEKLAKEAHTAKSSVLIFGMANTGLLLKEIQHLAEIKNFEEIQPMIKTVENELNQAKTELEILLKED